MSSEEYGKELQNLFPIVEKNLSDSGSMDNVVEFLVNCGGRSLPEAMLTLVPEAWQGDDLMNDDKKNYYKWSSFTMEPWDGPALLTFTGKLKERHDQATKKMIKVKLISLLN